MENLAAVNNFLKSRNNDANFQNYINQIKMTNMNDTWKERQVTSFLEKNYKNFINPPSLVKEIAHYALL